VNVLPVQDAMEYFLHLLNIINRTEHGAAERLGGASLPPTLSAFTYLVRLPCFLLTAKYTLCVPQGRRASFYMSHHQVRASSLTPRLENMLMS